MKPNPVFLQIFISSCCWMGRGEYCVQTPQGWNNMTDAWQICTSGCWLVLILGEDQGRSLQMMSGGVRGAWERVHRTPVSQTGCVDYHRKQTSWHLAVAANIRIVNKHLSFRTAVNVLEIAGVGICLQWASRITRKTRMVAGRRWLEITNSKKRFQMPRLFWMRLIYGLSVYLSLGSVFNRNWWLLRGNWREFWGDRCKWRADIRRTRWQRRSWD